MNFGDVPRESQRRKAGSIKQLATHEHVPRQSVAIRCLIENRCSADFNPRRFEDFKWWQFLLGR